MKKLYFLFFTFLITSFSFGQTTVFQENFEGAASYSTSMAEQTDGSFDYFTVTDGSTIGASYSSPEGSNFFAAHDLDADGMSSPATMTFDDINISTFTDLTFAILIAEDDDGSNEDWDNSDFLHIEYDIDNSGSWSNLLWIENDGSTFNSAPSIDTDFDGDGDGAEITNTFTEFTASLPSGSLVDIRITFGGLTSSDEDIALDNIRIVDGYIATPTLVLTDSEPSGSTITISPEDAATATIDFATTNFTVAVPSGGDGYIKWNVKDTGDVTIDSGDIFTTDGTETAVTGLTAGNTYTLFAELVDNAGVPIAPAVQYTLTVIVASYTVVADIAALRADVTTNGVGGFYEITGAVLVTHTDSFNDRQWVQDSNISGILITEEDADADIATYAVGDNVTGLRGTVDISNGLLRFLPTTDSGVVASSGNPVTPQTLTAADFNTNYEDYESELVELENVTFPDGDGVATFSTGTNYNVTPDAGVTNVVMRTDFFGADYIGEVIPSTELSSLVAVAGRFNTTGQIYARSLSDFTLDSNSFEIEGFSMYPNPTDLGYVNISSRNNSKMEVSVYDMLGKQVINETVANKTLDVSELNAGIYIMKFTQEEASTTKKLVIR